MTSIPSNEFNFHSFQTTSTYVNVVLPLALPKPYTYAVPEEWVAEMQFGIRVEVQFGKNKLYSGLVIAVHDEAPTDHRPKPILAVIDDKPIIEPVQLELWKWLADYYCCTLGEVMNAALPGNMKLASETRIILSPLFDDNFQGLTDKEYLIAEALTLQNELTIDEVRDILNQKTVYPLIKQLLEKKIIYLKEDLKTKYKPKTVAYIRLKEPYASDPGTLQHAFDQTSRSDKQTQALMAYIQLSRKQGAILKQELYNLANVDSSVIRALEKKGILEEYEKVVSRLEAYEDEVEDKNALTEQQKRALQEIHEQWKEKPVVLLQGVTGSGKTRVYVELIQEALNRGEQVLYLLPEIALTTQIVTRLQVIFGDSIAIYHSRLNNNERVELWQSVRNGQPIVLGARSSLFLPFKNLKLIIVDEEHDSSFKQNDPQPRYNGRDAAVFLAHLFDAKTILGTATPSIESYQNARSGKYGFVSMPERFGGIEMPEIIIVDATDEMKKKTLQSHFTSVLIDELKAALERGEQAILFQNRRGYAPTLRCTTCGWHQECIYCDVSLTYHKFHHNLKCHYCGYTSTVPDTCPACGGKQLTMKGFGTEKIEDELKIYLPEAKIGRMDLDTVRSKNAHSKIINDFEEKRLDILVGTQMVTKGLDFENVGIVGVLSADQLLQFPDFRASERAFQLITQVSGRAGRKHKRGKVIIQAFNVAHPVLREVYDNDFSTFFTREITERKAFKYPPYYRLIKITLKHKKPQTLNDGAKLFDQILKAKLGDWVMGPAIPHVSRVRNYYLLDWLIKLERDAKKIRFTKEVIVQAVSTLQTTEGFSGVRVNVDVDPM